MKKYQRIGCSLIAIIFLTFAWPGVVYANEQLPAADKDTLLLRQMITAYFHAVAAKSFGKLQSMTTEDFVLYEDGKIWNNDSIFRNIQYHQPFTVQYTVSDLTIFADTHSANACYHNHADFVVADTVKFQIDFIETMLFRKTASGWKICLLHLTELKSPEVDVPSVYRKYDTLRFVPEHYRKRMELFRSEALQQGGTVLLGNSITEFGDWKKLFKDVRVINRGIAGDNTFGMLGRLQEVMDRHPEKLIIEAGINDIAQGIPVGNIVGNISSIVEWVKVKSPGTKIYVLSVLPTNEDARKEYPEVYGKNAIVRDVDRRLQQQAGPGGFTFIDLATPLTGPSGDLLPKYARPDGLHLNEEGYAVLVGLLR